MKNTLLVSIRIPPYLLILLLEFLFNEYINVGVHEFLPIETFQY